MTSEFLCVVDTDGVAGVGDVDYTSLAAWYAAMRNAAAGGTLVLTAARSSCPVVVPGVLTGSIPDNSAVTQAVTGATGRLVHVARNGTALIASRAGNADDTHRWQLDASNYFTPSGPRAAASLKASCRGATPDGSVIDWANLLCLGLTLPIVIQGDLDPTNLAWDAGKFRWEVSTLAGVVNIAYPTIIRNFLVLRNLQVRNTSTASGSWTDATAAIQCHNNFVRAESCILRGGKHAVYLTSLGADGRVDLRNCVAYDYADSGVYGNTVNSGGKAPAVVQNCTLAGGLYGVRLNGGAALVENTYAHGTTAAYSGSGITLNRAASSDSTGSAGYRTVPHSAATFRSVTAGAQDYRLAVGSALAGAGVDLSVGRTRKLADVSGTMDHNQGSPVGVLAFESGSSVAVFRVWNSISDLWFDGVSYTPNDRPLDMSVVIPLRRPSTTSDWVAICTDGHGMRVNKTTVYPGVDALRAGTKGRWTAATDNGWAQGTFPCAGRLLHLLVLGDNPQPDDTSDYGDTLNYFRDSLWNSSGEAGSSLGMDRAFWEDRTWVIGGNHDRYKTTNPTDGLETWRFNQHGRTTDDQGNAYSDASELRVAPLVGNNRLLLLGWQFDEPWARQVIADAATNGENLFVFPHAPLFQTTRYSYAAMVNSSAALDVALTASADFVFTLCGHTHNYDSGQGLDQACTGSRADFPARFAWDIGAADSGLRPRARLRARSRVLRSIRS